MDLYLTINLTENLQKARFKRRKERMMEDEAKKFTKIKGFLETFSVSDVTEKMKMETELLNEYKALRLKMIDLRNDRSNILALNT